MCTAYDQYKAALAGRREDSSRFWTVFAVMSAINGAMLAMLDKDSPPMPMPYIAGFGVLLCAIWFALQLRLGAWVKWWEKELVGLEGDMSDNIKLFTGRELEQKNPLLVGFSTRIGGVLLTLLFLIAWIRVGWG